MQNALKVVEYLKNHPQVEKVHHPSVTEDATQKELYQKYFPNGEALFLPLRLKATHRKLKILLIIWSCFPFLLMWQM